MPKLAKEKVAAEIAAFAGALRVARLEVAGVSQQRVAEWAGVSPRSIAGWELGETTPQFRQLVSWGDALGWRVSLVDGADRPVIAKAEPHRDEEWQDFEWRRVRLALRKARVGPPWRSQEQICRDAGLNRQSFVLWESGDCIPQLPGIVQWAWAVDCRVRLEPK